MNELSLEVNYSISENVLVGIEVEQWTHGESSWTCMGNNTSM